MNEKLPDFKLLAQEPAPVIEIPVMSPQIAEDVRELILSTPEFRGEEGETGSQGEDGEQGSRGEPGRRGRRGEKGFPGTDGTGTDGRQGEIGAQGEPGDRGPRGPRGAKGLKGETGLAPGHEFKRTSLRFRKPDGTWGEFVDLRGPQGAGGGGGRGRTSTTAITDASLVGSDLVLVRDGLGQNIIVDLSTLNPPSRVAITVETPILDDNFALFFTSVEITVQQINFVLQGATDVTVFVNFDSDRSAGGTSVINAGTVVTSTTTGQEITSFDNAVIPADSWIWVEFTAVTGNPDEINVSLEYS